MKDKNPLISLFFKNPTDFKKYDKLFNNLVIKFFKENKDDITYTLVEHFSRLTPHFKDNITKCTDEELFYLYLIKDCIDIEFLRGIIKYSDSHSKNKTIKSDLFSLTIEDVNSENLRIETINYKKILKNQILNHYEDDEWLIITPLTHESSCKFGSNTKWCTSSKNDPSHFKTYSKNGVLIYVINKLNDNLKYGLHKKIKEGITKVYDIQDKEISFNEINLEIKDKLSTFVKSLNLTTEEIIQLTKK